MSEVLLQAILDGQVDKARTLLATGARVDTVDPYGRNALLAATETGNLELVRAVLAVGADVNACDKGNPEVARRIRYMANEGADENYIRRCLEHPYSMGRTALAEAAARGLLDIAECLLQAGAKRTVKDNMGLTPLQLALARNDAAMIRLLVEGRGRQAKPLAIDAALLQQAGYHAPADIVAILLTGKLQKGSLEALLVAAATAGDITLVRQALAAGADPNGVDKIGMTALVAATMPGLQLAVGRMEKVPAEQRRALIQVLLDAGADPALPDRSGWTPLSAAAAMLDVAGLQLLLAAGAPLETADRNGFTPLGYAIRSGDPAKVRLLLAAGARLDHRFDGLTPLELAKDSRARKVIAVLEEAMHQADGWKNL